MFHVPSSKVLVTRPSGAAHYMNAAKALPIVALSLLAGCLDETPITGYAAEGSDGWFTLGYAYDGRGVIGFDGNITITADESANTGLATVQGRLNGEEWTIEFDRYFEAAGKTFQDGGIAHDLREHGATGVADSSIPEVRVNVAAWGEARITVNDQTLLDPVTGQDRWLAHYMVILTGVRDDASHTIWNQEKTAPYDPAAPTDGFASTDREIHLVLRSHANPAANATPIALDVQQVNDPQYREDRELFNNSYAGSRANVTFSAQAPPIGRSQFRFEVYDPDGDLVSTPYSTTGGPRAETSEPFEFEMAKIGEYRLVVTGVGLNGQWSVAGAVTPPPSVVMNFWWETVQIGDEPASG